MNENINVKPKFLSPFKRFCMTIGELPTSYVETMTYYEMLLWFTKYLGETVIPTINNNAEAVTEMQKLFVDLQNYVNDYFDNLDVQDEINNKLDEMAESGQLVDIIAEYLTISSVLAYKTLNDMKSSENLVNGSICRTLGSINYLDGKGYYYLIRTKTVDDEIDNINIIALTNSETLIAERINEEDLSKNDNQQMSTLNLQRRFRTLERNGNHPSHVSGEDYAVMQGGTYTGNDKMIICRIRNNDVNDTLIQEISLSTGNVIREENLELAHANSVTYNPTTGKLYITSLTLNIDTVSTPLQYLYVVDYEDLTLDETITLDVASTEGVHGVSYDLITGKYYITTEDTTNNNTIKLYEMNIEDYSLTEITLTDSTALLSTSNNNDILVYDGIIYFLKFAPQNIITYDLSALKLRNIYNIENVTEQGNTVGELQNLSIKYDKQLKNIVIGTNHIECVNGFYNMFQYFECNPVYNISSLVPRNINDNSKSIYVDINSTAINPTGTSTNKFKHITEALELAQNSTGSLLIYVSDGTYPFVDFRVANCNVMIAGNTSDITAVIINGINLTFVQRIYLTALKVDNTSTSQSYDIQSVSSYLRMSNVNLNTSQSTHIWLRSSTLESNGLIFNNNLVYCQSESNIISHDQNPDYKITNQIPTINKPIAIQSNVTVNSTGTTFSYAGYELLVESDRRLLGMFINGNYNYTSAIFKSRANNGSRNVTVILGNIMARIQVDFNVSTKNITLTIAEAYQYSTTGITNVTTTASCTVDLYFDRTH